MTPEVSTGTPFQTSGSFSCSDGRTLSQCWARETGLPSRPMSAAYFSQVTPAAHGRPAMCTGHTHPPIVRPIRAARDVTNILANPNNFQSARNPHTADPCARMDYRNTPRMGSYSSTPLVANPGFGATPRLSPRVRRKLNFSSVRSDDPTGSMSKKRTSDMFTEAEMNYEGGTKRRLAYNDEGHSTGLGRIGAQSHNAGQAMSSGHPNKKPDKHKEIQGG